MLILKIEAPFAAARPMAAGNFRPTMPIVPPSAVYGLLLNFAGIETRLPEHDPAHGNRVATSLMRSDLPTVELALGLPLDADNRLCQPSIQSIYQQLHDYPIDKTNAAVPPELAKGSKNNIRPVRREFLADVQFLVACKTAADLQQQIVDGLDGKLENTRYGLPFLGDNSFLIDRVTIPIEPLSVRWYIPLITGETGLGSQPTRLTEWIDRADRTQTRSTVFTLMNHATKEPPQEGWICLPPKPL